ncbi:efflux RND transporter periplasmic adaptor subunit [Aquibium sp. ELW1220]|uniref:efflux RND transporter periplasmic adaptor subunit n=1 Tax=Aquibium sp. ELW1220 TaxID=2976766 RepID=UPI0025B1FDB0|nr:efflux RND transporter periplasmic adaptor subunit [Aquibium sp. ELW1220]MDN2581390.1 efflux RND transporter periplasmic adaptor subunit [Aquibium sp. ELW1220]
MDQIVEKPKLPRAASIEQTLGLQPDGKAPRRSWRWLVIGAVVLAAAIGLYAWWGAGQGTQIVAFSTVPVSRGNLTIEVSATGTLQPLTPVDVSSELSGVVRSVEVVENQEIARGDVLAALDTTSRAAQVERAQASLKAAEARLADARTTLAESEQTLTRSQSLFSRGMVSDQTLEGAVATRDRARSAVAIADANVAIAAADLKIQETDLAKSTIYAPIDGIVLTRDVDPGQTVASSLSAPILFVIAEDLKTMVLEAAIDEADIGAVRKGQTARFTVDAYPDRSFDATIADISFASVTTDNVVTYDAKLSVDNQDLSLRPGMTATVTIVTREAEGIITVPSAAFRFRPPVTEQSSGWSLDRLFGGRRMGRMFERRSPTVAGDGSRILYVLRDGAPVATRVRTGATDGEDTEILSGLEEGDPVIVATRTGSGASR